MNFRSRQGTEPDVNLTPLIDVVFLLLIFFMVSTTFKDESEIAVNLPKASEQASEIKQETIEITIDDEGQFYINQQRLINTQIATLRRALQEAAGNEKNPVIIIKADAKTPHQAVVTAMDATRQAGYSRLGFATSNFAESQ